MSASIETAQAANVFDATAALAAMRADWTALGDEAPRHVSPLEGDLDPALTGHTVYNFEVEGTHTYIADGVRVHNTSSLAFLKNGETNIRPLDGKTDFEDGYQADLLDGRGTVETVTTDYGDNETIGKKVTKTFTVHEEGNPNSYLNIVQTDYFEEVVETGEKLRVDSKIESITTEEGAWASEVVSSLTPFISSALAGKNANLFEKVAADTAIKTFLDNLGEAAGDLVGYFNHYDGVDTLQVADDPIEDIFADAFSDFPEELFANGLKNGVNIATQLFMCKRRLIALVDLQNPFVREGVSRSQEMTDGWNSTKLRNFSQCRRRICWPY